MKKSLFAIAATTAIAGAAQAQSSVTVYGLLDVGYQSTSTTANSGSAATTTNLVKKSTTASFNAGNEQTSRLGFKGNEDLGGGMSAFFTVEIGLTPQDPNASGAIAGTSASSYFKGGTGVPTTGLNTDDGGSAINNRQSFVGIKKNGVGQFAFGRQYTPIFNSAAATDPGAFNSVTGNVVYVAGGGDANGGFSNNIGFTNRASNALTVDTASFAGFQAHGMYALNNTNTQVQTTGTTLSGGNNNWNGYGLSADYTWQKLFATVAYQSFKQQVSYDVAGTAGYSNLGQSVNSAFATTPATIPATSTTDKQTFVGATYDFGILKAYGNWIGRKINQGYGTVPGVQLNRTAQQIGVRSYITPTVEAWASAGNGTYRGPDTTSGAAASVKFNAWQLGSNYYLSKRTNLYAIYGQQLSTSATYNTPGSGSNQSQYAVGVRHTF